MNIVLRYVLPTTILFLTCIQVGRTQRFFAYDTLHVRWTSPIQAHHDSIIYWSTYDIADCRLSDMPENPVNFGGLFNNSHFAIDGTIFQGSFPVATITKSDDDISDDSTIHRSFLRGAPIGQTPYAPETDGIGISADYNNRGCLVGQGVSVIDFWDRYVPAPEPVRYLGDLPPAFRPAGQMMFRESSFYYPSVNDELIQLKVGRDSFWARSLGALPDTLLYAGFFSLPHTCDSTTSYILHHNPQGATRVFTINLETLELTPYCEVPRKLIHAALEGENIQPPCSLELDLNLADTSTVHLYDTLGCAGSVPLLAADPFFGHSVVEWDSVTVQLSDAQDGNLETVSISGNQPNVIVHNRGHAVTLQSTGFTKHSEYITLLRELVYTHIGSPPTGGERSIEIRAYHPYYGEYVATVYLYVNAQNLQVAADISHLRCAGDSTGTVSLHPQNGEAPFAINWLDGDTSLMRSNLVANVYPFELQDADGCSLRDSVLITEPPALALTVSSPRDTICGQTGELLATTSGGSGMLSLQWSDGSSTAIRTGLAAGVYNLEVTDSAGCTAMTEYELFTVDTIFTTIRNTACAGESIIQENVAFTRDTSFQTLRQTVAGCDSLVSYELTFLDTFFTNSSYRLCAGESMMIQGQPFAQDTSFQLIETAANGCDSILQIEVFVQPAIVTMQEETICTGDSVFFGGQYLHAGGLYRDTLTALSGSCDSIMELQLNVYSPEAPTIQSSGGLCQGNRVLLAPTQSYISYQWSNGSQQAQISTQTPGIYSLTVTDEFACQATADYTLEEVSIVPDLEVLQPDCHSESGQLFVYDMSGGEAPYTVRLNGVDFENIDLAPGSYLLQVSDSQACTFDTNFVISPAATLTVADFPMDSAIDLGDSISLDILPNFQAVSISWSPQQGINCFECLNPTFLPDQTTIYRLILSDENGCKWQGQFTLRVNPTQIYIPNAFSPNDDGYNDTFLAYPRERILRIAIYDRWGAQVFVSTDTATGWDGRIKDQLASSGVYLYVVEWLDGVGRSRSSSGEVTLVR